MTGMLLSERWRFCFITLGTFPESPEEGGTRARSNMTSETRRKDTEGRIREPLEAHIVPVTLLTN